jgi:predicted RNA polymerase sigma factor
VQAIAELPLADERTTEAHDFEALFREAGSGVFRTLYAYTAGRRDIAEEAIAEEFARACEVWHDPGPGRVDLPHRVPVGER